MTNNVLTIWIQGWPKPLVSGNFTDAEILRFGLEFGFSGAIGAPFKSTLGPFTALLQTNGKPIRKWPTT